MFAWIKLGRPGDPHPRDPQCCSHKVEGGHGDAPPRASEEPGSPRIDDAIGRSFSGLWQRGQEIAHLPPYAAAMLQAAGTKQENASHVHEVQNEGFPSQNRLTPLSKSFTTGKRTEVLACVIELGLQDSRGSSFKPIGEPLIADSTATDQLVLRRNLELASRPLPDRPGELIIA